MNSGAIAVNKPSGFTSHDVVAKARGIFKTKKIGHTGTLDPMATGVLVLLVGNAVKASDLVGDGEKRYRASFRLGIATDTEDVTGKTVETGGAIPSLEELRASAARLEGGYQQTPPMYSAVKVDGKKLYEYARRNQTVERTPKFVTVTGLTVLPTDDPLEFVAETSCSRGTYIRTLLCDLARGAGALCAMSSLVRTLSGGFTLEDCVTLEQLQSAPDPYSLLVPVEKLFSDLPAVTLPDFYKRLAVNGQPIYSSRSGIPAGEPGSLVRLYGSDGCFFALARAVDTEEGGALKVEKRFI